MKNIKHILFLALLLSNTLFVSAQQIANLDGINYQAVAIDDEGKEIVGIDIEDKPLYEKTIGVRFTIQAGADGAVYYQDTHTTTTDKYGLFSLVIGHGTVTDGTILLDIPWINGDQWLKVEISIHNDGNYKMVSNQQFMAVPYSFYTDDIADDAITTAKILNEEILAEDIGTGSVETSEILDETILAEDIATSAVETSEILNGTILNEDIANGTIDLSAKIANVATSQILIGDTLSAASAPKLKALTGGSGISIVQSADSVIVSSTITGGVNADGVKLIDIGIIAAGDTYISSAFPVPGGGSGAMGDIVLASLDTNLKGCIITPYFFSANTIKVAIFNGTGSNVNLGNGVTVKLLIVQ